MKFDHFNISAPADKLEAEKTFFCDVFDLKEGDRPTFSRPGYWLYFEDNPLLHMMQLEQDIDAGQSNYLDHIAFELTDLKAFKQRLANLEIEYRENQRADQQLTQLFFSSPNGVGLEVCFRGQQD